MIVFRSIESYTGVKQTAITTGTFDGVHQGHLSILDKLVATAKRDEMESVLITFEPHPRKVIFGDDQNLKLLSTLDEKLELLSKTGVESVIIHPFTLEFSRTTAHAYVRDLLIPHLHMATLVIGYDHQFGKNREGSIEQLRSLSTLYGFSIEEIPPREVDEVNVSSTKARKALEEGDVARTAHFLGYPYFITAHVVAGRQRGQKLGFPTANLQIDNPDKLIPADGVYAVRVAHGQGNYQGMLSIGTNPTFGARNARTIELNIFGFNENIYGQNLRVYFISEIRKQQKFDSSEALIAQLHVDRERAKKILEG